MPVVNGDGVLPDVCAPADPAASTSERRVTIGSAAHPARSRPGLRARRAVAGWWFISIPRIGVWNWKWHGLSRLSPGPPAAATSAEAAASAAPKKPPRSGLVVEVLRDVEEVVADPGNGWDMLASTTCSPFVETRRDLRPGVSDDADAHPRLAHRVAVEHLDGVRRPVGRDRRGRDGERVLGVLGDDRDRARGAVAERDVRVFSADHHEVGASTGRWSSWGRSRSTATLPVSVLCLPSGTTVADWPTATWGMLSTETVVEAW